MPTTFANGHVLTGPELTAALATATSDAAAYFMPQGEMVPSQHHAKLAAASSPVVWFLGDSTMTLGNENPINIAYTTQAVIRAQLQRAYPSKTFTFYDLAQSGTGIYEILAQISGAIGSSTPTQIYIGTGVNNGPYFTDTNFIAVLTAIAAISSKPDTFFVTPRHTNSANAYNSTTPNWQPSMDWIGSYARSVARGGVTATVGVSSPGSFCCIDIGRAYAAGVKGYDPDVQTMTEAVSSTSPLINIGNTSSTVQVEVYAERVRAQGQYITGTEASLTYVAIDDTGKPRAIVRG